MQSIYGPGIAALYQHQPPPRHANPEDNMYMMQTATGPAAIMNANNTPYQITRPTPMFQKPPQPIVEDISV